MSRVISKVVLTEAEERKVIRRYAQMEHSINPSEKCSIGVGYTTCMDIGFRAVDFFQAIQPQIEKLEKEGKIKPYVHAQITNLRMFIETFLYYFSNGANAERSCVRYCIVYLFRIPESCSPFSQTLSSKPHTHSTTHHTSEATPQSGRFEPRKKAVLPSSQPSPLPSIKLPCASLKKQLLST